MSRSFEKAITGTALGQTGQVLQALTTVVLWVGASLVLSGDLTLGQLSPESSVVMLPYCLGFPRYGKEFKSFGLL